MPSEARPDVEAEVLQEFKISYPESARRQGASGTVRLRLLVDEFGNVVDATILESVGHGLDEAALIAIARFKFRPATKNGQPVASWLRYRYVFILDPS